MNVYILLYYHDLEILFPDSMRCGDLLLKLRSKKLSTSEAAPETSRRFSVAGNSRLLVWKRVNFEVSGVTWNSRWWQLKYSWNFHPDPWGFMIQFDGSHIFFNGWGKTTN